MRNFIFVSGLPGVGKSTYIQQNYSDDSKYFIFHFAPYLNKEQLLKDDDEEWAQVFNCLMSDAMCAWVDGKTIVIELVNKSMKQEAIEILHILSKSELDVEWIEIVPDELQRIKQYRLAQQDPFHYASADYENHTLYVLRDLIDDILNQPEISKLMLISSQNQTYEILVCKEKNGETLFFAVPQDCESFIYKDDDVQEEELDGFLVVERFSQLGDVLDHGMRLLKYEGLKFHLLSSSWKNQLTELLYAYTFKQKQRADFTKPNGN